MMLAASAAARDFSPNPLPNPFLGYGRVPTGLGEMSKADAASILGGAASQTATAAQKKEAWEAYYGAEGFYAHGPSVVEAAREAAAYREPPGDQPAPMLYAAMPCGANEMGSGPCVSFNAQVQRANMALLENARREWKLKMCEYDASLNPKSVRQPCDQYQARLDVPPVAGGVLQEAECSGGQCYTPYIGTAPTAATGRVDTVARDKPNQSVPPRPQPGEVPVKTAAEKLAAEKLAADGGKIFGMEPMTLAVIAAAGVGALMLLKK